MLKLESRNLKFEYDEKECSMRFPTAREWGAYQTKIKEAEGDLATIDVAIDFFSDLGLDREIAEKLEPMHIEKIAEALTKKN